MCKLVHNFFKSIIAVSVAATSLYFVLAGLLYLHHKSLIISFEQSATILSPIITLLIFASVGTNIFSYRYERIQDLYIDLELQFDYLTSNYGILIYCLEQNLPINMQDTATSISSILSKILSLRSRLEKFVGKTDLIQSINNHCLLDADMYSLGHDKQSFNMALCKVRLQNFENIRKQILKERG